MLVRLGAVIVIAAVVVVFGHLALLKSIGSPRCVGSAERGLLDQATRSIECPPDTDLAASIELAGAEQAAIPAIELPGAVHLAGDVEAPEPDLAVVVAIDRRDRITGMHACRVGEVE